MARRNPGLLVLLLLVVAAPPALADKWPVPEGNTTVVGRVFTVHARAEDTLLEIGRRYGLGYQEITNANPDVDVWLPGDGTPVIIPRLYILPDAPRNGIVLNVPEMRLYYYPQPQAGERPVVITHPVAVGRMNWQTPLGVTKVVAKVRNPVWYPPESIRREHAEEGDYLPPKVPPGPNNPLGGYAIKLGIPGYLIHSTNKPAGVGMRVSHGCVRMYPEDMVAMFNDVPVGTTVRIINEPVKAGWRNGQLYLAVHPPFKEFEHQVRHLADIVHRKVRDAIGSRDVRVDQAAIEHAIQAKSGIPVVVATATASGPDGLKAPGRPDAAGHG